MDCCGCIGKLERCQQLGSAPSRERVRVTAILFKLGIATLLGCAQLENNLSQTVWTPARSRDGALPNSDMGGSEPFVDVLIQLLMQRAS